MTFRPYRALTFSLLILSLLLAACQQNTIPTLITAQVTPGGGTPQVDGAATLVPTSTPDPTIAPAPTTLELLGADPGSLKGKEIDFWHPWQGALAQRAQAAVDEFNRTNEWGIKVRVKAFYSSGAVTDALSEADKAGGTDLPDLIAAPSDQLAGWSQNSPAILVDLTKYIAGGKVGLSEEEVAAYQPAFWSQDVSGDLRFGLPALREARVLFYNQGWAAELGFNQPPKTPADFKRQACAAAQKNNTAGVVELYGTGGLLVDSDPLTMLSWMAAFNAQPIPEKDGQPYRFNTKEGEQSLKYLRDLVDKGCAWIARSGTAQEHFARRKALFYSGTLAEIAMQNGWQEQLNNKDSWTILPFPGEDGKALVYSGGQSYAVLKSKPEDQLSAWLLARWLSAPQTAARLGEALPSLPVSSKVADAMKDKSSAFPWNQILSLTGALRPEPSLASWRQARRPLEDAAWQVYHLPPETLSEILPQLDATVQEVLKDK